MRVGRERDHDPMDAVTRARSRAAPRVLPSSVSGAEPFVDAPSSLSTNPTTSRPYSGCVSILVPSRRATGPDPTMTTFWTYASCLRASDAGHDPKHRHQQDGQEPELDQARERRMRKPRQVRGDEEAPRPEGNQLDDPDHVVDRRVVAALLVAVVQPVNPREQRPERQGAGEECELPPHPDRVRRGDRRERERGGVCHREPDQVGERAASAA